MSEKLNQSWNRRLEARDPHETHRAATPLELLFDLSFVIAIAQAATQLHHALSAHHAIEALPTYGLIFFAIWWAWMNFTWFASAYDNDDVRYRLKVLLQIAGALVIAAGVKPAFEHGSFAVVTAGYALIRVSQIALWLRAAKADPPRRRAARRYATGLAIVQAGWIAAAVTFAPIHWPLAAIFLIIAEFAVPVWAEKAGPTTWHPHHIAERYGLLTIIVLGESLLGATMGVQSAVATGSITVELTLFIIGALLTFFAMWWIYFEVPAGESIQSKRDAFVWGYGHLIIFAATAAVGAGIAFLSESFASGSHADHGHGAKFSSASGLTVGIPVALFVVSVWYIHIRKFYQDTGWLCAFMVTAATVLAVSFTPWPLFAIGLTLLIFVTFVVRNRPGKVAPIHPDGPKRRAF